MRPVGAKAGGLTKEMAAQTGLREGTSVAVSIIDAHAATPVVGVVNDGTLVMTMGTSLCHILVSRKEVHMKGISGVVKDGVIPGYYGYEAGQAAVGDIYDWFIQTLAPSDSFDEAAEENTSPFAVMDRRAAKLKPGENGLLALDWWNGNRSMLNNANLSGVLVGMTLSTQRRKFTVRLSRPRPLAHARSSRALKRRALRSTTFLPAAVFRERAILSCRSLPTF